MEFYKKPMDFCKIMRVNLQNMWVNSIWGGTFGKFSFQNYKNYTQKGII